LEWLRLIGLCMLTATMVIILRQMNPTAAGLLCAAFGVMMLGMVLPQIRAYISAIRAFLENVGLDGAYYGVMLKAMGIVLITQIAVQVCQDMDAQSIAKRVELCGRLALLGIAVPVFIELADLAVRMLTYG